jgi:hypothetical protein
MTHYLHLIFEPTFQEIELAACLVKCEQECRWLVPQPR